VVVCDEAGRQLSTVSQHIGEATNNEAEWEALRLTLERAKRICGFRGHDPATVSLLIQMDSELVVRQWSGEYRVKRPSLAILRRRCQSLAESFARVELVHIPRDLNTEADRLANRALDERERMMGDG